VQGCQNLGCCWDATATPAAASADDDAGGLITGIAAAAGYLGYDKPDGFRRARTRHPIPGETRTSDGRPAWTPATLQAWRSTTGTPATAREPGKAGPAQARD
jgi:hypothetical protein